MKIILLSLTMLTVSFAIKAQTKFFTNDIDTVFTPDLDGKYLVDSIISKSSITAMKTNDEVIKPYLSEYIEFNGENISRYYLYNNQETLAFSALWDWTGYGFSFTDEFPVLDKTIKIESEATEDAEASSYEMNIVIGGSGFGYDNNLPEGSIRITIYSHSKKDDLLGINFVAYEYYLTKVNAIEEIKVSKIVTKELRKDVKMLLEMNK